MSLFVALALLGVVQGSHGQEMAGTYSFAVCDRPCSDPGITIIADGHFVLFRDTTELQTALTASAITFHRMSDAFNRGPLNACYTAVTRQRSLAQDEVYVGIWPAGRTNWQRRDAEFTIRLYQSPDAWADFIGTVSADTITGINRQLHCCGRGVLQVGHVRAVRSGPVDVRKCDGGAEAVLRSFE